MLVLQKTRLVLLARLNNQNLIVLKKATLTEGSFFVW